MKIILVIIVLFQMNLGITQTDLFSGNYFLNSVQELMEENVDSILISSGISYYLDDSDDSRSIIKKEITISPSGISQESVTSFFFNNYYCVDSISYIGIQSGVLIRNNLEKEIIDYKEGKIIKRTFVRGRKTIIIEYEYVGNLVCRAKQYENAQYTIELNEIEVFNITYYKKGKAIAL